MNDAGPPPNVSPNGSPGIPLQDLADMYGTTKLRDIDRSDPAFQPPRDPLTKDTKSLAGVVYRDIPLVTIQNAWTVDGARGALYAHMMGQFDSSAQLFDSILGDDRVMATMGSRNTGLFGRPVRFRPANDSAAAKEVCDAWEAWWPRLTGDASLVTINTYAIGMGFSPAQIVWDTSGDLWGPLLRPWHPRFTYYHWPSRTYHALSQDGEIAITPGDGKWLNHCPYGEYRGWIRGAVRALTEPWLLRHFAFRDMARFSEIHGLPTRVGMVPAVCDPGERAAFEASLANLGSDTAMILPQTVDVSDGGGYDYKLVEATDAAWQAFPGLMDRCEMAIVLAILFQNLTTEVKGGSFAATEAHMDVRQGGLQGDNAAWLYTMRNQVGRPFAWLNFGDADLAPFTDYDVTPAEDFKSASDRFASFSLALQQMKTAGIELSSDSMAEMAKRAGLPFESKDLVRPPRESQVFKYHIDYGTLTTNEIRARLGLGRIDGGDEPPEPVAGATPGGTE